METNKIISAKTEIDDLLMKRNSIMEKTAGIIAEAMVNRVKHQTVTAAAFNQDINNLISGFSDAEKIEILTHAFYLSLAMNGQGSTKRESYNRDKNRYRSERRDRTTLFQ